MTNAAAPDERPGTGDPGSLFVEEQRFAVVPEWVIDAGISDGAFRLHSLLLRYGNSSGCRMPSQALLGSTDRVDTVDRTMRELQMPSREYSRAPTRASVPLISASRSMGTQGDRC